MKEEIKDRIKPVIITLIENMLIWSIKDRPPFTTLKHYIMNTSEVTHNE